MGEKTTAAPRCAALVGPYLSGKTTLLESLLFVTGAVSRKGTIKEGNTVGDSAPEARARKMSVEIASATTEFLGESWCFLDCPGSVELAREAQQALMVADAAIVVCEPEPAKALTLAPLLKFLDDRKIPHLLFVNKMDIAPYRVAELMAALQAVSARPLVLRQVPIRTADKNGVDQITGYVDLVSERAYQYKPGQPSDLMKMPETVLEREQTARRSLLESLADFDDALLEQLLEDAVPSKDSIYQQLTKDLAADLIVPVFLGAAERDHGVRRLLKTLRHEVPDVRETAKRLGIASDAGDTVAQVFKTYHQAHTGKLSLARVWSGKLQDGMTLSGHRVGSVSRMKGHELAKLAGAAAGEVVALGRMEEVAGGALLSASGKARTTTPWPAKPAPLFSLAIDTENRADEVKLTAALHKLVEEDEALSVDQNPDTHELVLWGQGEIHLQIAIDRLRLKYNLPVKSHRPQVNYKETIRKGTKQHSRFKRQSGGHGQFADIHVGISPLPRGKGFEFHDEIVGGAVPRQYIPSVEEGVREYLVRGPLGFPVVDLAVTLTDGQFHTVDSSDMAFKTAARMAMTEALPNCEPVLLEPIYAVTVTVPTEFTSRVHGLISGRRGQILGFDAKEGWSGWDEVSAHMPQSELHDLIIELRSLTLGVGTFAWKFDHLQELIGRIADKVVEQRVQPAH
ncbi:MAG TPA: elongation factor G [Hypericibacter adhaerens]|uniref:Elongation factor G n=1 Tax=Hypericibacter adhaerens TaxID=2602016 RepID=A0A5J6N2B5_9PROT|nr:elongation factor G [Hypericibacter adhaerens]QEX21086.1 elongation factor G [Hypericibacter adhaerens]HWA46400.1 elongation factor G [Hypericibacter adhaerens]